MLELGRETTDFLEKSIDDKKTILIKLLNAAIDNKEVLLILDNNCFKYSSFRFNFKSSSFALVNNNSLIDYKGEFSEWFYDVLKDKSLPNQIMLCVASKTRLKFKREYSEDDIFHINILELSVSERKRLFAKLQTHRSNK